MSHKLTRKEVWAVLWADDECQKEFPELLKDNYRQADYVTKVVEKANKMVK